MTYGNPQKWPANKRFEGTRGSVVGVRLTLSFMGACARAPQPQRLARFDDRFLRGGTK
jgi:hypothetical protein